MTLQRIALFTVLIPLALGPLNACSAPPDVSGTAPERIRVGVLPDQEADVLRGQYEGLIEHLAAESGFEVELVIPASYDDLLDRFHDGRIELAWFGGLTFLRAEQRSGATPLVMRDVDQDFTSDFLVARSSEAASLRDFDGATIAFGPELSTSGHLMPRAHIERLGLETRFPDVRHSSGHDETARWVQDGTVSVGAVNSVVVEAMLEDGRLSPERVRVLERTLPYRNYLWAVRPDLPPAAQNALRDAFLELQVHLPPHAEILHRLGAGGYVPVSRSDYAELHRVARSTGLLGDGAS